MKRLIYLSLFVLMSHIGFAQKKVIAVAPFDVPKDMQYRYDFNGTGLLEKIPALLEAELFETGLFEIVERARLDVLMDEQTLGYAGVTDQEYDYGALKGVDLFVMGQIAGFSADFDNVQVNIGRRTMYVNNQEAHITLTVKLVDVTTGKLMTVITEEASVTEKGRPRGNSKHGVDKDNVDKCAKKVVSKIADRIEAQAKS